jgi:hypothetical protein
MDQQSQPGWWRRNWKWAVPVGCLLPVVVCGGFFALIFTAVFGAIKSSDAYTEALARAKASPEVQAALGTPIEPGFFVSGSIKINNNTGNADLSIPVSGPKGSATIRAVATRAGGPWQYSVLEVLPDGGGRIDLLEQNKK